MSFRPPPRRSLFWAPLLSAALGVAALAYFAAAGWPGEPNRCTVEQNCFCEAFHAGPVKQPVNTWSALVFLAAGLLIAADETARRKNLAAAAAGFNAELYSALVVLVGVGTASFHASMTRVGGMPDYLSMYVLLSFVFAHGVTRAARLQAWAFYPLWLLGFVPFAALNIADVFDTPPIFAALVAAAVLAETAAARLRQDLRRQTRLLWLCLGVFAFGFAVWALSNDRGPLCAPHSPLQGHALWHFCDAAAAYLLYRYYASENKRQAQGAD